MLLKLKKYKIYMTFFFFLQFLFPDLVQLENLGSSRIFKQQLASCNGCVVNKDAKAA
jgi:hypothetical protein